MIIIKPKQNIIELQKYGAGKNLFISNKIKDLVNGEEYLFEYGAVDTPDGNVHITFKIDGETVMDHIDTEYKLPDPGYFSVFKPSDNTQNKLTLIPVGE